MLFFCEKFQIYILNKVEKPFPHLILNYISNFGQMLSSFILMLSNISTNFYYWVCFISFNYSLNHFDTMFHL